MENVEKCPLEYAFSQIGGKHKGRIIWRLHLHSVLRFGEIRKQISGISIKMLTQVLKEMEKDNIIIRKQYDTKIPKVEYYLTDNGKILVDILERLFEWGKLQENFIMEDSRLQ